ncbi:hypothetical protein [Enterococcus innesii]
MAPLIAEVKPDSSWLKFDIQKWLDERGIDYETTDTKAILLEKAGD